MSLLLTWMVLEMSMPRFWLFWLYRWLKDDGKVSKPLFWCVPPLHILYVQECWVKQELSQPKQTTPVMTGAMFDMINALRPPGNLTVTTLSVSQTFHFTMTQLKQRTGPLKIIANCNWGRHLYRPRHPFWGPLAAILDLIGCVVLQAVSECPRRCYAGIRQIITLWSELRSVS